MGNSKITAIILAAGQSKRMGPENKLLAPWRGKSPLEYVCQAATGSMCDEIIVVTGHQHRQTSQALSEFKVKFTHNREYASGMASSIKTGVMTASQNNSGAVMILLGDMPGITCAMIDRMIAAGNVNKPDSIIVATSKSKRGNPVLWPSKYFDELLALDGDTGARQIISKYEDNIVELELGAAARFDLDTPDAFADNS